MGHTHTVLYAQFERGPTVIDKNGASHPFLRAAICTQQLLTALYGSLKCILGALALNFNVGFDECIKYAITTKKY